MDHYIGPQHFLNLDFIIFQSLQQNQTREVSFRMTIHKSAGKPSITYSFVCFPGNNPTSVCELCTGHNDEYCATSDPSAGFDGAFRCVADERGDLTFVRHDTIDLMTDPMKNPGTTYTRDV